MTVDTNDPEFVLWLQQSLMRVIADHVFIFPTGEFDSLTEKAVFRYQMENGIPPTKINEEIVARIKDDLAVLDAQPYKKKRRPVKGITVGKDWPTS